MVLKVDIGVMLLELAKAISYQYPLSAPYYGHSKIIDGWLVCCNKWLSLLRNDYEHTTMCMSWCTWDRHVSNLLLHEIDMLHHPCTCWGILFKHMFKLKLSNMRMWGDEMLLATLISHPIIHVDPACKMWAWIPSQPLLLAKGGWKWFIPTSWC